MIIDISKKDKAAVFKALYDFAHPKGMGVFFNKPGDISIEQAREIVAQTMDFDYVGGRVMKVNISGDSFDSWLYDRDNGKGRAKKAIDTVPDTL